MIGGKNKLNEWTNRSSYINLELLFSQPHDGQIDPSNLLKNIPEELFGPSMTHFFDKNKGLTFYVSGALFEE